MKRHIKEPIVALFLIIVFTFGVVHVQAQDTGSLAKQMQGTWLLVSMYNEQDGKKTEPFGPNPRGIQIFMLDGRYAAVTMKASLPKFASNNRLKGTAEEYQSVVQGSNAYFGTYKVVNEKEHLVSIRVEASTFANWDGQDQTRVITISGDEMKVTNPTTSVGGTSYVILKRAK